MKDKKCTFVYISPKDCSEDDIDHIKGLSIFNEDKENINLDEEVRH